MRIKKNYQLRDCWLIQFHILQTIITLIVWQTVRRITQEILGVKGLNSWIFMCFTIFYTFGLTPPVRLCGLHKNAGKLTSPTIKS